MFVLPGVMRTYLLLYTNSRIWMVELLGCDSSILNTNYRIVDKGQLFYSLIQAYDPKEAIGEGKRLFINHIKTQYFN